jgi:hypothetical protein
MRVTAWPVVPAAAVSMSVSKRFMSPPFNHHPVLWDVEARSPLSLFLRPIWSSARLLSVPLCSICPKKHRGRITAVLPAGSLATMR